MATTINATTTGLVETSDGTDVLDLQTGGTTALRVNASQAIGVGSSPSFGTAGQFLTSQGNAASPTWTSGGSGTVTSVGWTGGIVSIASATTTPAFTIAGTSGGIPYFSSGTTWASSAALTQYALVVGGGAGAAPAPLASLGTTTTVLHGNAAGAPTFGAVSLTADVSGTLPVANGGTGQTTYTDGQLLIGNTSGNTLTKATLTAGTNVTITNGNGSITIAASGGGASAATPTALGTVYGNTSSANNTVALGYQAAATTPTASSGVAIGYQALTAATGANNTAVGYQAGNLITTGVQNTCIGYAAASTVTTGGPGIFIGSGTASASGTQWEIVIGNQSGAVVTGKGGSTGFINPNGGGVYQGNNSASWSTTSDQRLKKNIVDNNVGLDAIKSIQVRNFEYRLPEEVQDLDPVCAVEKTGVQLGVIAQELQQVLPNCVKQESTGVLSVDPDNLTWYMVNAIKQLSAALDAANARIAALEAK
jgi:hypothetical protein